MGNKKNMSIAHYNIISSTNLPIRLPSTTFTPRAYDYCLCYPIFFVHMTKSA